jgi:hypothetical protein
MADDPEVWPPPASNRDLVNEAFIAAEREAIRAEARKFRWRLTGGYAAGVLVCGIVGLVWLPVVIPIWLANLLWTYRVERMELRKLYA